MENNVTLFTASDFGRTLTSNGDGSDHGWGAHQAARWFGVADARVPDVLPDIANFGASRYLGFLA